MFKRGDKIVYKNKNIFYNLTLNKTYIVKSHYYKNNVLVIQIVDDNDEFHWFLAEYFEMNLIEQRINKINKIKDIMRMTGELLINRNPYST